MSIVQREWRSAWPLLFAMAPALLVACDGSSALAPHGPAARQAAVLTWILFAMAAVVTALVVVLLAMILWRGRRLPRLADGTLPPPRGRDVAPEGSDPESSRRRSVENRTLRWVLLGGVALPTLVVTPLFFYSVALHGRLLPPADATLVVEVEGRQWFWVVRYLHEEPQLRVTSANELHIPVGRPVQLRLSSPDVIHSFWVPALQGKTDLIPGIETVTWIQADRPGVYRGQCAEYCGLQHARMAFLVVAHEPADFDAWLERERRPAPPPDSAAADATRPDPASAPSGFRVFQQRGCAVCHTVRGTAARGTIGPDLTHVASRRTLAAGTLPNNRGNLTGWIANPQVLKPGNRMPRVPLTTSELHAVVAYLESLR